MGSKRIELRLYDEKRKLIKVGDQIRFLKESNLDDYFDVKVVKLLRYNTFLELFNDYDITILADKSMTKEELLSDLSQFYTDEKQKQFGVVGIVIEL